MDFYQIADKHACFSCLSFLSLRDAYKSAYFVFDLALFSGSNVCCFTVCFTQVVVSYELNSMSQGGKVMSLRIGFSCYMLSVTLEG